MIKNTENNVQVFLYKAEKWTFVSTSTHPKILYFKNIKSSPLKLKFITYLKHG